MTIEVAGNRRDFLMGTAAVAASTLAVGGVHAAGNDTLKIGLVGCGGRGSGAAANALKADPNVKLTAVCDIFEDRAKDSLGLLKNQFADKVDVTPEKIFSGFDGYKQLIDSGVDVVLLCSTPGFRPTHLKYAVEKNKHIFMEKPHAVDPTGVRSVVESAQLAKQKGLGLVSGFCYRYDAFKRQVMERVHNGEIGDVHAVHSTYLTGGMLNWHRGLKDSWTPMEQQIRNWYYYTWLSGDFLVEQAIHSVDKAAWAMNGEMPISASGMGGREVRKAEKFGNIFDHFTIVYEYKSGAKVFLQCRQTDGCYSDVSDQVFGTKGIAQIQGHTIQTGNTKWTPKGEHDFGQMYQTEHNELFASIRAGKPINDGERSAMSTLMGIMGREAAYTGKLIKWDEIMKSTLNLTPKNLAFGPVTPESIAIPGKTKLNRA
jgi:myo-inositol 2-dehydrogenase / D-chiro-inositol 1-dehydrogenase